MRLDTYLNYAGSCEAAFRFYEQQLGGKITVQIPHARLEVGDAVLLGADIPGAEPMRSAYVTLTVDDVQEAERLYQLLADGGQVFMKMEKTFFASRFAMLRDRFGTSWMLLAEVQTLR